jgi:hypothetical protein
MAYQRGVLSYMGIGEESVWGTAATRDRFIRHISESLNTDEEKINQEAVYREYAHVDENEQGLIRAGGDFTFIPQYSNRAWTTILKHIFGTVSTIHLDPTLDSAVYRHNFSFASVLPTGLTLEVVKETKGLIISGAKLESLRLAFSAGAPLRATIGVVGKDGARTNSPTALSDVIGNMILCTHATLSWNSETTPVREGELMIENPHERVDLIGQRYTGEPVRSDLRRVTGRFNISFENWDKFDDFQAATQRTLTLTFTSPNKPGTVYFYDMKITCPVNRILSLTEPADRKGPIISPINFQSFGSGASTLEATAYVTNGNTAA